MSRKWREMDFARVIRLSAFMAPLIGQSALSSAGDYESLTTCGVGISTRDIAAITADPRLLLTDSTFGGERMAWRVRVLGASGHLALQAIGRGIHLASQAQKDFIGEGLARAAEACDDRDGLVATEIAELIRDVGDSVVTEAFTKYLTNARASDNSNLRPTTAATGAWVPPVGAVSDAKRYFDGPLDRDLRLGDR